MAFQWLTRTDNAKVWLSSHQKSIMMNADHYEEEFKDQCFVLNYENGDVYIGRAAKNGVK